MPVCKLLVPMAARQPGACALPPEVASGLSLPVGQTAGGCCPGASRVALRAGAAAGAEEQPSHHRDPCAPFTHSPEGSRFYFLFLVMTSHVAVSICPRGFVRTQFHSLGWVLALDFCGSVLLATGPFNSHTDCAVPSSAHRKYFRTS